mgnify:CR=1 FL=1
MRKRGMEDLTVSEVLTHWPQVIPLFLEHRMACVGCALAPFETLSEVLAIYGLSLHRFLQELQRTLQPKEGDA